MSTAAMTAPNRTRVRVRVGESTVIDSPVWALEIMAKFGAEDENTLRLSPEVELVIRRPA